MSFLFKGQEELPTTNHPISTIPPSDVLPSDPPRMTKEWATGREIGQDAGCPGSHTRSSDRASARRSTKVRCETSDRCGRRLWWLGSSPRGGAIRGM